MSEWLDVVNQRLLAEKNKTRVLLELLKNMEVVQLKLIGTLDEAAKLYNVKIKPDSIVETARSLGLMARDIISNIENTKE